MEMREKAVDHDGVLPGILAVLVLVALVVGFVRSISLGHASPTGVCPTVLVTQQYTFLYGEVTLNAIPAPPGSVVEARNPRGDTVGCQLVENAGEYPLMYVYGEETVAGTPIPGMRAGEVIALAVDGWPATPAPIPTWANDWNSYQVDLAAVRPTTSAQISPAGGGTLDSEDGHVHLDFPAGTVTGTTTITYTAQTAPAQALGSFRFAGRSFTLEATAEGQTVTQFNGSFTLTLIYDDADWQAAGITDENQLNLYYWDGSDWVGLLPCDGCSLDTVNNQLTVSLDHLTEFGLLACTADIDHNGVVDIQDIQQAMTGWQSTYTMDEIRAIAAAWRTGCGS